MQHHRQYRHHEIIPCFDIILSPLAATTAASAAGGSGGRARGACAGGGRPQRQHSKGIEVAVGGPGVGPGRSTKAPLGGGSEWGKNYIETRDYLDSAHISCLKKAASFAAAAAPITNAPPGGGSGNGALHATAAETANTTAPDASAAAGSDVSAASSSSAAAAGSDEDAAAAAAAAATAAAAAAGSDASATTAAAAAGSDASAAAASPEGGVPTSAALTSPAASPAAPATVVVAAAATAPAVPAASPGPCAGGGSNVLNLLESLQPEMIGELIQYFQQNCVATAESFKALQQRAAAEAVAGAPAAAASASAAAAEAGGGREVGVGAGNPPGMAGAAGPLSESSSPGPAEAAGPVASTAAAADSDAAALTGTSGNTAPCAPDSAEPAPATTCGSSGPPAAVIQASASTLGGDLAKVIPLGLVLKRPTESPALRSLPEFIRDDIQAALPGLLSPLHEKTDPNLQSFVEFVLDTMLEASAAHEQSITCIGLTPVQLKGLRHGKCVHGEVADIWAHWVAYTLGAPFWNEGTIVPGCPSFDPLAMYLARDKDCDKTLVLSCSFMNVLLVEDNTLGLDLRNRMLQKLKGKISQYNRFLCTRVNEGHFTTVHMTKSPPKTKGTGRNSGTIITAQLADSSGGNSLLESDPALQAALKVAVTALFEGAVFNGGFGIIVPRQNANNDCCFHTILNQASTLSGKRMTSDNATCQQDAARLRDYTVLLAHKDLRLRDVKLPDLQELRRQWELREATRLKGDSHPPGSAPKRSRSPTPTPAPAIKAPRGEGAARAPATTADDSSLRSADGAALLLCAHVTGRPTGIT